MEIVFDKEGLSVNFPEQRQISRISYNLHEEGWCKVFSKEGKIISEFQTVCSPAYNHQYGTPTSLDEKYLFVGTWEKGLHCYDILNGILVWKKNPGKVRRIIVCRDCLIVEMADRGIYKRDIGTGELITELKMSSIDLLQQISSNEVFAGPKRNKFFVFSTTELSELHQIQYADLNVNHCLSFIILNVQKQEDKLVVSGWEQYPQGDYNMKGISKFVRSVPLKQL